MSHAIPIQGIHHACDAPRKVAACIDYRVPAAALKRTDVGIAVPLEPLNGWVHIGIMHATVENRHLMIASNCCFDQAPAEEDRSSYDQNPHDTNFKRCLALQ